MKEDQASSLSAWDRYVSAKKAAFAAEDSGEPLTMDQLEEAIAQAAASAGIPETGMPPRAEVHPVKRSQLSKWFYLTLVVLFALLVAGLLWWGQHQQIAP
ncbi:hypothetical protein [Cohnella cellulosilytica]|uniref:Uncharacterized protein n=1 Tax=Cohnella cellulosilytica TaxID=986710 RepID=A0ABW2F5M1_9BACL